MSSGQWAVGSESSATVDTTWHQVSGTERVKWCPLASTRYPMSPCHCSLWYDLLTSDGRVLKKIVPFWDPDARFALTPFGVDSAIEIFSSSNCTNFTLDISCYFILFAQFESFEQIKWWFTSFSLSWTVRNSCRCVGSAGLAKFVTRCTVFHWKVPAAEEKGRKRRGEREEEKEKGLARP